jgi:hypothetical protein
MIIIFLIVIILILLYFILKNKDTFIIKNVIKGNNITNEDIIYDNTKLLLGDEDAQQDFITVDLQFYLKVSVPKLSVNRLLTGEVDSKKCPNSANNWVLPNGKCCDTKFADKDSCLTDYKQNVDVSYYLNNGNMCPKQIGSACFKRLSNMVSEALLLEGIPKKQGCIQSGCIPESLNDDYCCSKESTSNLRCGKGYKNKSCVPINKSKKKDGVCLKKDETKHNCTSGTASIDNNCKSIKKDNFNWKCGSKKTSIISDNLYDDESIKYNINDNTKSGLWKFMHIENKNDKLVYYGHELLLTNVSNIISYLCVCDSSIDEIPKCGKKVDIYCYNEKQDALKYGKWIIIPKFFNKFSKDGSKQTSDYLKDINKEDIDYDFYEDYRDDNYDFETLRNKKIPIQMNDRFLIVHSNKIDGQYVYLNFCGDDNDNLSLICNNTKYNKVIGTIPNITQLANFSDNDLYIYNWSIVPTLYDVNVYDTLYVDGSITLGDEDPIEITSDTLRYIKSIPYHFDKEICVKDENNIANCINKEHIEMLNGSRPINIQSVAPAKPFILYSGTNYTGRELRIGFDYENNYDLPYIGDINEWLNPNDHGKWKSLKIEGPYSAIIFNKPNFGYDTPNVKLASKMTLDQIKAASNDAANNDATNNDAANNDATNNDATNNDATNNDAANNKLDNLINNEFQHVVNAPGITNIRDLDGKWDNGIRSIIFRFKNKDGAYKEKSSNKKSYEMKCLEKKQLLNQPYKQNNNKGDKWNGYVKNEAADTVVDNVIYTANLCKNGNYNQNFYLFNHDDDKFVDSNIYDDIESEHIHFHKHPYPLVHEEIQDNYDI